MRTMARPLLAPCGCYSPHCDATVAKLRPSLARVRYAPARHAAPAAHARAVPAPSARARLPNFDVAARTLHGECVVRYIHGAFAHRSPELP